MNYNQERKRLKQQPSKRPPTEKEKFDATRKLLEELGPKKKLKPGY
jgi:hypothetical protein